MLYDIIVICIDDIKALIVLWRIASVHDTVYAIDVWWTNQWIDIYFVDGWRADLRYENDFLIIIVRLF